MKKQSVDSSSPLNTEGINTNFLYLMHIHDSAFPIGSYTQSFGMETYIQSDDILTKQKLFSFLKAYVSENLLFTDAIFVKEAYEHFQNDDWNAIVRLENICDASKNATETREASKMMGKQFLRGILPVFPDEGLTKWKAALDNGQVKGHFPIVYSLYTLKMAFDLFTTILTYLYSSTISLVHNGVRAIPLGQKAGIEIIHKLIPEIIEAAKKAMNLNLDDLSNHAVGLEIASMQHAYLHSRLFIS
ncbi:urease accessory protein UreF [Aquibacillus salsiterrae]|uniref:Urease accessory protein UreF n=1 Tax=Aquibacillus salsiterrae TaxID=2950439 RepID=A0A9X3WC70_9BACI|nr:urease accessory protein UreF [Aquibacillus salsiterrae]MDC3415893.1 urease accessory protein UreF [Aquibacillus salsiterrae]